MDHPNSCDVVHRMKHVEGVSASAGPIRYINIIMQSCNHSIVQYFSRLGINQLACRELKGPGYSKLTILNKWQTHGHVFTTETKLIFYVH